MSLPLHFLFSLQTRCDVVLDGYFECCGSMAGNSLSRLAWFVGPDQLLQFWTRPASTDHIDRVVEW